jgi:vacuolar-type H+-ATPase subunit F/Vma7
MGFRLAGFRVRITDNESVLQDLEWARSETSLVMLSAAAADRIPQAELDQYLSMVVPSVVIVPDVHGDAPLPDLALRLRSLLGVEE